MIDIRTDGDVDDKEGLNMSRIFGPATQNGFVVPDLDQAMAYWVEALGVGPFFRFDNLRHDYFHQRDMPIAAPEMSIAIANWGDLQIELICPHGAGQSTWHQFLGKRGGGLHHISVWSTTFDRHVGDALSLGRTMECRGQLTDGPRYTYFMADRAEQPLLEIAELRDDTAQLFAFIRDAARNWDGKVPVRSFDSQPA